MVLVKQTIPFPIGMGVGQHVDSKMLAGKLGDVRNSRFAKAMSLNKRTGFTGFEQNSTSAIDRLGAFRGSPVGTCHDGAGGTGACDYLLGSYAGSMLPRARLFGNCVVDTQAIESSANDMTDCDFATNGTYRVYAWVESGVVKVEVRDDNGEIVAANLGSGGVAASRPRVVFCNGKLMVGYLDATTQLIVNAYSTTTWTSTGTVTLNNVLVATPIWDWAAFDTFVVVAYNAATGLIRLNKITSAGASSANQNFAATADSAIAVATPTILANGNPSSNNVLIYYHDNTNGFRETRYDTSLVQQVAPTTLDATPATADEQIIAAEYTAGIGYVIRQRAAAATYNRSLKAHVTSAACASLRTATQLGTVILSKLRRRSAQFKWNFIGGHDSTLQSQSFLFELFDDGSTLTFAPTARIHYGVGGGLRSSPTVANIDASIYDGTNTGFSVWETAVLRKQKIIAANGTVTTIKGVDRAKFDFRPDNFAPFTESADTLTMAGGFLAHYDGITVCENGFFMAPENVTAVQTVGGGSLSAGTYQFIICYEWTDGVGRLHRSARSVPVSQAVNANDRVTLTIPTYRISLRTLASPTSGAVRAAVSIVVYRTLANGSIFYRDSSATAPLANAPTSDTVSYVSSNSDATLQTRDILYATGGIVDNYTVDAPGLFLQGPNRVYVEANGSIWPSKRITPGQAIAFAAEYERKLPLDGGRPTAMSIMDDRIVVFRRREILSATGDGPDNTNTVDTLSDFKRLHDKIGCVGSNACVATPLGILFKSDKGYYFLSRNLSLTYVGADVEDYNGTNPYRAIFIPDRNEVRFKLARGTGTVLVAVLSEAEGDPPVRWTIDDNFDRVSDLAVVGNTIWAARGSGLGGSNTPLIYYDDQTVFTDAFAATTAIVQSITTPWFKASSVQGLMRIYRAIFLGALKSSHTAMVEIGYNYEPAFSESHQITSTDATTGASAYQFIARPAIQKAEAIRFRFSDVSPTGESFSLQSLELEVGVKPGLFRMNEKKEI